MEVPFGRVFHNPNCALTHFIPPTLGHNEHTPQQTNPNLNRDKLLNSTSTVPFPESGSKLHKSLILTTLPPCQFCFLCMCSYGHNTILYSDGLKNPIFQLLQQVTLIMKRIDLASTFNTSVSIKFNYLIWGYLAFINKCNTISNMSFWTCFSLPLRKIYLFQSCKFCFISQCHPAELRE